MNGLDLFSGIGGISLALKQWVRTVAYCESDRYAQSVLLSRMRSGDIDTAPIWDDVRTLKGKVLPKIDIISGGFPCQDISTAGAGAGLAGERSGLFFEIARLTSELRPRFVFLENVPAITLRGLDRVLLEFAALGYDARWTTLSAASVGACHRRDRWWLLAYPNSEHRGQQLQPRKHQQEDGAFSVSQKGIASRSSSWISKPTVGRSGNGIPFRLDRLRCDGNSVVPPTAQTAFRKLLGI